MTFFDSVYLDIYQEWPEGLNNSVPFSKALGSHTCLGACPQFEHFDSFIVIVVLALFLGLILMFPATFYLCLILGFTIFYHFKHQALGWT